MPTPKQQTNPKMIEALPPPKQHAKPKMFEAFLKISSEEIADIIREGVDELARRCAK